MSPKGANRDVLDATLDRLSRHPGVIEVRLGGSFARGEADEYSDLDLTAQVEGAHMAGPMGAPP